jgi:hypothetical protein
VVANNSVAWLSVGKNWRGTLARLEGKDIGLEWKERIGRVIDMERRVGSVLRQGG